jgi:hypothetical protein
MLDMGVLVNVTWGDSWRRPKEGLGRVIDGIQALGGQLPKPMSPEDPSVEIDVYISGKVWQHDREGFKLGTLNDRGHNRLRVMIFVPDDLCRERESMDYFKRTLDDVATAVEARLRKRRPAWPIETLALQIRSLKPTIEATTSTRHRA